MTMQQPILRDDSDEYDGHETAQKEPCVRIGIPLTPGQHKNVEAG